MSFDEPEILASPTGAMLALRHWPATGQPRALVHVNHGLSEHSRRYARFAAHLAGHGFHVYAHDHRGHGFSRVPGLAAGGAGRFAARNGAELVLGDVDAVNRQMRQRHPGLPVLIFGHSMGGLIALAYAMRFPGRVDAAAIWNASFSAGMAGRAAIAILAAERMLLGSDVPSMILPKLTFRDWNRRTGEGRTDADWLSRDPAEVDAYIADPLCGWPPSVGMWRDIFSFVFDGADDRLLSRLARGMPINLVGGAADPATEGGKAVEELERRMRNLGFGNVNATNYPDTRHEGLNDINRDMIMRDFAAWALASFDRDGR